MELHIKELQSVLSTITVSNEDRAKLIEVYNKMQVAETTQQKWDLYIKWLSIFISISEIACEVVKII